MPTPAAAGGDDAPSFVQEKNDARTIAVAELAAIPSPSIAAAAAEAEAAGGARRIDPWEDATRGAKRAAAEAEEEEANAHGRSSIAGGCVTLKGKKLSSARAKLPPIVLTSLDDDGVVSVVPTKRCPWNGLYQATGLAKDTSAKVKKGKEAPMVAVSFRQTQLSSSGGGDDLTMHTISLVNAEGVEVSTTNALESGMTWLLRVKGSDAAEALWTAPHETGAAYGRADDATPAECIGRWTKSSSSSGSGTVELRSNVALMLLPLNYSAPGPVSVGAYFFSTLPDAGPPTLVYQPVGNGGAFDDAVDHCCRSIHLHPTTAHGGVTYEWRWRSWADDTRLRIRRRLELALGKDGQPNDVPYFTASDRPLMLRTKKDRPKLVLIGTGSHAHKEYYVTKAKVVLEVGAQASVTAGAPGDAQVGSVRVEGKHGKKGALRRWDATLGTMETSAVAAAEATEIAEAATLRSSPLSLPSRDGSAAVFAASAMGAMPSSATSGPLPPAMSSLSGAPLIAMPLRQSNVASMMGSGKAAAAVPKEATSVEELQKEITASKARLHHVAVEVDDVADAAAAPAVDKGAAYTPREGVVRIRCTKVNARQKPTLPGKKSGSELRKNELFAAEKKEVVRINGVDVTFWKVAGDHGWLFDRTPKAPKKTLVSKVSASFNAIRVRASKVNCRVKPELPGKKSGAELRKHEVFAVAEEVVKTIDGVDVTFFKIKGHDHGWLFDRTPKAPNKVLVQRVQC